MLGDLFIFTAEILIESTTICKVVTLREKCPNTELFLVRISCIRTEYGPEITPYFDTFHAA